MQRLVEHRSLPVLFGPGLDLPQHVRRNAWVVISSRREVTETGLVHVYGVQAGEPLDHGGVDSSSLGAGGDLRESRVSEEDSLHVLVAEERSAQHRRVLAEAEGPRDGDGGISERMHDAVLSVHRMGSFKKLPRRLLAENQSLEGGRDDVGGVRLPVRELP